MEKQPTEEMLQFVISLTKDCGELIRTRINDTKKIEEKASAVDLVTETDQEVEKILISALKNKFPGHKFIGEESTAAGVKCELTSDPTWIIDPIDGTMNFVHGYPNVCISIGYVVDKVPTMGIIYNPIIDWLFTARKGHGAFHNGKPINVSKTAELSQALITYETAVRNNDPKKMEVFFENIQILCPIVHAIRAAGSAVTNMALVAMGGCDAYIEFGIHAWDVAAGYVVVTEAGGVVIDPAGGDFDIMNGRVLCAGTSSLAQELAKTIKQYYPPRDDE